MYLAELIFPSTSVIVPTPSYKYTLKTLETRVPPHVHFSLVNKGNNKIIELQTIFQTVSQNS
jgi:hypothetical protein